MNEYTKPLPKPTPWSKPFWEGCKQHKLLIQECLKCNTKIFYPKLYCPICLSSEIRWIEASGKGRVYTFTTVYNYQPADFSSDVPYIIAVIRLDEGVQLMSNIVDCTPEEIGCDMEVEVVFEDVTDNITLPKFRRLFRK